MKTELAVVDLFCGIGGLSYGLKKAGLNVTAGIDFDTTCEYAYEQNIQTSFLGSDISQITGLKLNSLFPRGATKILVGCAPCQPFSKHTNKNRGREKDKKWFLLNEFARLIREVRPEVVSMENVPELIKKRIFETFVQNLREMDYFVSWSIVRCPEYGIPQNRKRLVLLASRRGPINLVPPTHSKDRYLTARKALKGLTKTSSDPLHVSQKLSEINLLRIKHSQPGGTWRDWPEDLKLKCHQKATGKSFPSVYGRMKWDEPSPTITTQFFIYGTGRFGHPSKNRALTLREGAILQTFPKNFKFLGKKQELSFTRLGKHIGNAVPPKLGFVIGKSIRKHFNG